jgi:hypothetical protein
LGGTGSIFYIFTPDLLDAVDAAVEDDEETGVELEGVPLEQWKRCR